jgi:hypothetical protein
LTDQGAEIAGQRQRRGIVAVVLMMLDHAETIADTKENYKGKLCIFPPASRSKICYRFLYSNFNDVGVRNFCSEWRAKIAVSVTALSPDMKRQN